MSYITCRRRLPSIVVEVIIVVNIYFDAKFAYNKVYWLSLFEKGPRGY